MNFNQTHETIDLSKTVFDGTLEQPVDFDYTLPDYYPSIFKLLKCQIVPCIYSCRTSGEKLVIDGASVINLMYVCEEENQIHSLEQKIPFSKTTEMQEESFNPSINYKAHTEYANCRVINPKKIDIRGAISIHIQVANQQKEEIVSNAEGAGIQLNRRLISMDGERLWNTKQFSVSQEIPTEHQPPIEEVLSIQAEAIPNDVKVIANKMITKGDVFLHILYRSKEENSSIQTMHYQMPISQIIDMPGIDEDYLPTAEYNVTSVEHSLDENAPILPIDLEITANCSAFLPRELSSIVDVYSTKYPTNIETKEYTVTKLINLLQETIDINESVDASEFEEIIDILAKIEHTKGEIESSKITFHADLKLTVLGYDKEGSPLFAEKTLPISFVSETPISCDSPIIRAASKMIRLEHSFSHPQIQLHLSFLLTGEVFCKNNVSFICNITVDEENPKQKNDSTLTLYYPNETESIWDIAKRYNTSVEAIIEENDLDENMSIHKNHMILVPIVD